MSCLQDSVIPLSLIEALRAAFEVQASTPVRVEKARSVTGSDPSFADIVAALGMKSSSVSGTLAICFPTATLMGILNRMLGENPTQITDEHADAAGEFLNIIYASARVKMNEAGHDFQPAIPTVTRGKSLSISHGGSPRVVRVDCRCEFGPFYLEVSLRKGGR